MIKKRKVRKLKLKLINSVQKMERERLHQQLHDALGPSLALLKLQMQNIKGKLHSENSYSPTQDIPAYQSLLSHFDSMIKDVTDITAQLRELVLDITPENIRKKTLMTLISDYAKKYTKITGVNVNILESHCFQFSEVSKDNLYRIFQESLHNSYKHANAESIDLSLKIKKVCFAHY